MANLAGVLKEEIGRIARKEVRQQATETTKSMTRVEREVAALKKQIEDLQRKLASQRTQGAPRQTATGQAASKKTTAKPKADGAAPAGAKSSTRARFSSKTLKMERERLGLSADNYGKLVGFSGLSIYNWEQEKARPRESSIARLMAIRGIGKREAARRLEEISGEPKAPKARAKQAKKEDQPAASEPDAEASS